MIYFIKPENINMVKIGQSDNPLLRLNQLQIGSWEKLDILKIIKNPDKTGERIIHHYFKDYRSSSNNEWYELKNKLLSFISILIEMKSYTKRQIINILHKDLKFNKKNLQTIKFKDRTLTKFQLAIKQNKDFLLNKGFNGRTLRSWMYGMRRPNYRHALVLGALLKMDIKTILHSKIVNQ